VLAPRPHEVASLRSLFRSGEAILKEQISSRQPDKLKKANEFLRNLVELKQLLSDRLRVQTKILEDYSLMLQEVEGNLESQAQVLKEALEELKDDDTYAYVPPKSDDAHTEEEEECEEDDESEEMQNIPGYNTKIEIKTEGSGREVLSDRVKNPAQQRHCWQSETLRTVVRNVVVVSGRL